MSTVDNGVQHPAFSAEPLQQLLETCAKQPFEQVMPSVREELSRYEREDDYTLIVLEVQ
jgi:hypothetical protein